MPASCPSCRRCGARASSSTSASSASIAREIERELEAAVRRGVKVRALIAHTNRGGENRLRKLEQRLLAAGDHRLQDGGRSAALSRQVPDRRRHAARLRVQLHQARHRQEPQLRHRHARSPDRQRSVQAVRSRLHAAAVLAVAVQPDREPGDRARRSCRSSSAARGGTWRSTTRRSRTRRSSACSRTARPRASASASSAS